MSRLSLLLGVLSTAGCFGPIDLDGRRCPCDDGWACVADRCVLASLDGGARDAPTARDAPEEDAPERDVPGRDAPAPTDTATDAPDAPSSGCPAGAVCDDFESGPDDRVPPFDVANGTPSRTTVRAHAGAASGHFTADAPSAPQHDVVLLPDASVTDVWARFWGYLPSEPAPSSFAVFGLVERMPPYENLAVTIQPSTYSAYATGPAVYVEGGATALDVWRCFVFHAELTTTGVAELWVDGSAAFSRPMDLAFTSGLGTIGLGQVYTPPDLPHPVEVWFDDVVITTDGTPLSCDP